MNKLSPTPVTLMNLLDKTFLDQNGVPVAKPAAAYKAVPSILLKIWGCQRGVYQFITTEMVDYWVREQIGDLSAIEICAGYGTLGRALGIPVTDVKLQDNPVVRAHYLDIKHGCINYPADVEELEALEAIKKYKPKVVMGCYITQYSDHEIPGIPSSPFGPKEWEFFNEGVEKYIVFGNTIAHSGKQVYGFPHEELCFDWLLNKGEDQANNRVWVFDKNKF